MEGNSSTPAPRRVFLGWDRPPLVAAAEWLMNSLDPGPDRPSPLVALPAARAVRALRERLARLRGPGFATTRIVTVGAATDELLDIRGTPASRLARTLAWQHALKSLPPPRLHALVPRPPEPSDSAAWARLAEEARRLFGEVAAEGLSFADVAEGARQAAGEREAARWETLALAQTAVVQLLEGAGLVDPHLARLEALRDGRVHGDRHIVLVGVVDANALLRRALAATRAPITALVFAAEDLAGDFDAFGCLDASAWSERDLPISPRAWHVVDGPDDQAREVCAVLAALARTRTADDVSIGVADPEVAPHLSRRLAERDMVTRDAAGTPLAQTTPVRLLEAVASFLAGRDHAAFASLVRHADLRTLWNGGSVDEVAVPAVVDAWQRQHLPGRVGEHWPITHEARHAKQVYDRLLEALGALGREDERPLADWCAPIREFLVAIYDEAVADESSMAEAIRDALGAIGDALGELESVPTSLGASIGSEDALRWLLRALAGRALPIPVPAVRQSTIDLLGWLDLPLDDAPVLIVTGFQDGFVPEASSADAFLPNGLRRQLGLVDDSRRVARDAYTLSLLSHSREQLVWITGRRSAAGDPLLPSRLAFHATGAALRDRVRHAFGPRAARADGTHAEPLRRRELPRIAGAVEITTVSTTAFRDFLQSPYLFYVRHVLGLETLDDRAEELDARLFGIIAHDVLAEFGRSAKKDSTDADEIAGALVRELDRKLATTFGRQPLPAVTLQREQLVWRLRVFAARQAERRRAGWRIDRVEWSPGDGRMLDVGRKPVKVRGRIDRIDQHESSGEWAILDYKTSESAKDPAKVHRRKDGTWRDLQLPLYAWLAESVVGREQPRLGYVSIGSQESHVKFQLADKLGPGIVESALGEARRIIEAVRAGEVFDLGAAPRTLEPTLAALCGTELLVPDDDDGDEDGGGA